GEAMVLVTPTEPVRLADGELFRLSVGGAESTVALYLTEFGYAVRWARRVAEAPTAVSFRAPAPAGPPVHYYRAGSAASRLSAADADAFLAGGYRLGAPSRVTPPPSPPLPALV